MIKTTVIHNPKVNAAKADYVICYRVADLPIPYTEARIETCCKCNERIWIALSSPEEPSRICYQCIEPIIKKGQTSQKEEDQVRLMVTEKQIRDMAKKGWL